MRRMKSAKLLTLVLASLASGMAVGCSPGGGVLIRLVSSPQRLSETVVSADRGWFVSDKVAVIDVDGVILNDRRNGLWGVRGENPVSLFIEKLDCARADRSVKAVVLRINSPGGGVTASDMMYRRLLRFGRQRPDVPVIAIFEDVGASGAYYLACGAREIFAHPTSVTGSIGVIAQTVSFADTMDMLGIEADAITSGKHKDMGSPLKPLDPDDRRILQGIVDDFYQGFLGVVAAGRPKLGAEKIKKLADGRVYTGKQALELGLVDRVGQVDDAVARAKELAGVEKAKVVMYYRAPGYRANIHGEAVPVMPQLNLVNVNLPTLATGVGPRFLYLWAPQTSGRE